MFAIIGVIGMTNLRLPVCWWPTLFSDIEVALNNEKIKIISRMVAASKLPGFFLKPNRFAYGEKFFTASGER